MGRYRILRQISAPPDKVFRAFTDPALVIDWMDGTSVINATGPLDHPGTRYTFVVWGPWRFDMKVVRVEPARLHEISGKAPLGGRVRMIATMTPNGGGTAFELVTEYTVPLGPIGRWIDRRWLDREPRTIANREVDRLVTLVTDPHAQPQPKGASRTAGTAAALG